MYPKRNVYTQWRRISCFIVLMGGLNQPLRQTNRRNKQITACENILPLKREGVVSGNRSFFLPSGRFS